MPKNEEWRKLPGWDWYEVSSYGRFRRAACPCGRLTELIRKPYNTNGYLWFAIRGPSNRHSTISIQRAVALAFHGLPPGPKYEAAHGDGNPLNNKPNNIRWATSSENQMDRVLHGRSNRGERQHKAKLKEREVIEIRSAWLAGDTRASIAMRYGVSDATIKAITDGRSWYWLESEGHVPGRKLRPSTYIKPGKPATIEREKIVQAAKRFAAGETLRSIAIDIGVHVNTLTHARHDRSNWGKVWKEATLEAMSLPLKPCCGSE